MKKCVYSDYVHTDRLGSVVNLTDQYGRIPAQIDYDDWGKVTAYQSLNISGGYRTVLPEITYAGHQYDDVLGMYYAKARMYDAENRRFASVDPMKGRITEPMSLVQYLYVVDNPLRWVDLLGQNPTTDLKNLDLSTINSINVDNKTYYNTREIFEALHGYVNWDKSSKTATFSIHTRSRGGGAIGLTLSVVQKNGKWATWGVTSYQGSVFGNTRSDINGDVTGTFTSYLKNKTNYISYDELLSYFEKIWCKETTNTNTVVTTPTPTPTPDSVLEQDQLVTLEQIQEIGYRMRQKYHTVIAWEEYTQEKVDELNKVLYKYDITDINEIRHFLAQVSVESQHGGYLTETPNANHFASRDLSSYNTVQGWEDPRAEAAAGDGMLYRGGGYMHLTWKQHYYNFAKKMAQDYGDSTLFEKIMSEGANALTTEFLAWESAAYIWTTNVTGWGAPKKVFNDYNGTDEHERVKLITRSINGGYTNLNERTEYYDTIAQVIK